MNKMVKLLFIILMMPLNIWAYDFHYKEISSCEDERPPQSRTVVCPVTIGELEDAFVGMWRCSGADISQGPNGKQRIHIECERTHYCRGVVTQTGNGDSTPSCMGGGIYAGGCSDLEGVEWIAPNPKPETKWFWIESPQKGLLEVFKKRGKAAFDDWCNINDETDTVNPVKDFCEDIKPEQITMEVPGFCCPVKQPEPEPVEGVSLSIERFINKIKTPVCE